MRKEDNGQIIVDDVHYGTITGFIFEKNEALSLDIPEEVERFIVSCLEESIDILLNSGDAALRIESDFTIRYQGTIVGRLKKSENILVPDLDIVIDDRVQGLPLARLALHIQSRVKRQINVAFDPLEIVRKTEDLTPAGQEFVEALTQTMGYVQRGKIQDAMSKLSGEERAKLRKSGVRFAQYSIFVRDILKPAAQETKIILWSLMNDLTAIPPMPPAGVVTIDYKPELPAGYYDVAGYKVCGQYAVRADMIEKLADSLRPLTQKTADNPNGEFILTSQLMSLVGKSGEAFEAILKSLGYGFKMGIPAAGLLKSESKTPQPEVVISAETPELASEPVPTDSEIVPQTDDSMAVIADDTTTPIDITLQDSQDSDEKNNIPASEESPTEVALWFWQGFKSDRPKFDKTRKTHFLKKPRDQADTTEGTPEGQKPKFVKKDFVKKDFTPKEGEKGRKEFSSENRKPKKPFDKNARSGDRKPQGQEGDKPKKHSPYVNMPGQHKVSQENNPFAILAQLRK